MPRSLKKLILTLAASGGRERKKDNAEIQLGNQMQDDTKVELELDLSGASKDVDPRAVEAKKIYFIKLLNQCSEMGCDFKEVQRYWGRWQKIYRPEQDKTTDYAGK